MKKTLAALIIGAFAASAANAAVVYDNEGTKVEVGGSLRVVLEKANNGDNQHTHSNLRNAGSRLQVKVKHDLSSGYYALGQLQVRFDGKQSDKGTNEDGFGALGTRYAFVGLGHKERGDLTFGRQTTIADSLSTANDYAYGIVEKKNYLPTEGDSVIRYSYKGIDNLEISANYLFANQRDKNEVKANSLQNGFQVGAVYEDGIIAKFGYGRTNYALSDKISKTSQQDGFLTSLGYDFGIAKAFIDAGYSKSKNNVISVTVADAAPVNVLTSGKSYFVSPGFIASISEVSNVYGNYKYEAQKITLSKAVAGITDLGAKQHGFLLGVDYKLHKQVVTFVEGKYTETQPYANGRKVGEKVKDKAIGVGMRVFF